VGAVVVLLGIGIGAYFLFQPGDSNIAAPGVDTTTTQPPAATAAPPSEPPEPAGPPLADLPGQQVDTSEIRDFAQVPSLGYLTEGELDAISDAEPSEAAFALSEQNGNKLIILVIRVQDAAFARDELARLQLQFQLTELAGLPPGVRGSASDDVSGSQPVLRRAHYASGDYLVRVQASGTDTADVDRAFRRILSAQQKELAADG
jgi:hypothetical protein